MIYDKGPHIDWWQSLDGSTRFKLMRENGIKQITNKSIYRIYKNGYNHTR